MNNVPLFNKSYFMLKSLYFIYMRKKLRFCILHFRTLELKQKAVFSVLQNLKYTTLFKCIYNQINSLKVFELFFTIHKF